VGILSHDGAEIQLDKSEPMAYGRLMGIIKPVTVIETPSFLRDGKKLLDDDERGSRIIESMKEAIAISRDELAEDAYHIHIPERIDVKAIREQMGLSQPVFANRFGLSIYTLRNWEQEKRQPDPAARAYLKVIEKVPEVVSRVLASPEN
jgi:putative transcriptional regulator